jgi:hypothetical protein
MTRFYVCLCFLYLCSINCFSQESGSFPSIDESDLPDARFESPKIYTGTSLFGYINGGAELFLEYGFSGAWVNEINFMGGKYTTEIYRMNGPEEAFGIYSVFRFQCKSCPPLSSFTCQTKYQLQICSGPFYISIINGTGNKTDSAASLKIGEAIVRKIKERPADFTVYLPDVSTEVINQEAILVKGNLGIMNGAPDLADFFGETNGYSAVIMRRDKQIVLSVQFLTKEDLNAFASLHHWDPEKLSAGTELKVGEKTITRISDNHLQIQMGSTF